jgi:hypothetical protein
MDFFEILLNLFTAFNILASDKASGRDDFLLVNRALEIKNDFPPQVLRQLQYLQAQQTVLCR